MDGTSNTSVLTSAISEKTEHFFNSNCQDVPVTTLVYCDSCVFIDYLKQRNDDPLRPLYEFAFNFFSRGWNCAFSLLVSDHLIQEITRHHSREELEELLTQFGDKKVTRVNATKEDREEAFRFEHKADALHAIIAGKHGADVLVTRNIRDFDGCEKYVTVQFPESV